MHNVAVSDALGEAPFYVHASHPMQSGFSIPDRVLADTGTQRRSLTRVDVKTVALDEYLGPIHVDVLKIDVEGFEPAVVRGARDIIQRNPDIVLIIERNGMSDLVLNDATEDVEMLDFLRRESFVPHAARWLQPIQPCDYESLPHCDLVFTRNPRAFVSEPLTSLQARATGAGA